MGKMVEIDDKFYRERRGKMVEITKEWKGNFTTKKAIHQRPSKLIGILRRANKISNKGGLRYIDGRHAMLDAEA